MAEAQRTMLPTEYARLVETLGIGRQRVDKIVATARAHAIGVTELRPSAWFLLFKRPEPIPLLPGEATPIVDHAMTMAEPPEYRRRVDLLSADGLALMLVAMHQPEALSSGAVAALAAWLEGSGDQEKALEEVRSWRTLFPDKDGQEQLQDDMGEWIDAPKEADQ